MRCHDLSFRKRTSITPENSEQVINKISSYLIQAQRVPSKLKFSLRDMYANWWKTCLRRYGGDQNNIKSQIEGNSYDVYWLRKSQSVNGLNIYYGAKLKAFTVLKGAKRETAKWNSQFKGRFVVGLSWDKWIDPSLTM